MAEIGEDDTGDSGERDAGSFAETADLCAEFVGVVRRGRGWGGRFAVVYIPGVELGIIEMENEGWLLRYHKFTSHESFCTCALVRALDYV